MYPSLVTTSCLIAGSNFTNTFCVVIAIIVVAPLLYLVYTAIVGCCLAEFLPKYSVEGFNQGMKDMTLYYLMSQTCPTGY